jgi:hypothetical protein
MRDSTADPDLHGAHVVALRFPDRRELCWMGTSAIAGWQVGEVIFFRNRHWRVVERSDEPEAVTMTLATHE